MIEGRIFFRQWVSVVRNIVGWYWQWLSVMGCIGCCLSAACLFNYYEFSNDCLILLWMMICNVNFMHLYATLCTLMPLYAPSSLLYLSVVNIQVAAMRLCFIGSYLKLLVRKRKDRGVRLVTGDLKFVFLPAGDCEPHSISWQAGGRSTRQKIDRVLYVALWISLLDSELFCIGADNKWD